MYMFEEVVRIEKHITKENKKQNKVLEDIASSLKEMNEIKKNNTESKIVTRWIIRTKYYNFLDSPISQSEATVISETKEDALERAKKMADEPEHANKIKQCVISAEDIIIS